MLKRKFVILFLLGLGVNNFVLAQQSQQTDEVFQRNTTEWIDEDDPRFYDQIKKKYVSEIRNDNWAKILKDITIDFQNSTVDWEDNNKVKQKFLAELSKIRSSFNFKLDSIITTPNHSDTTILSDKQTGRFGEGEIMSNDGMSFYLNLFAGRDNEILFCAQSGYPDICEERPKLSVEQAKDIRYRADAIHKLLKNEFEGEQRDMVVDAILKTRNDWKNFIDNGYTMYPWEGLINGWLLKYKIKSPPRSQWIAAHPSMGLEVSGKGFTSGLGQLTAKEVLVVEWIGTIWYTSGNFKNYSGISGITTFREDIGLGVGGMIHFRRSLRGGITWHFSNQPNKTFIKNPFLTFSVDLFGLLKSNKDVVKKIFNKKGNK